MTGPLELALLGGLALAGLTFYLVRRSARRRREPVTLQLKIESINYQSVGASLDREAERRREQMVATLLKEGLVLPTARTVNGVRVVIPNPLLAKVCDLLGPSVDDVGEVQTRERYDTLTALARCPCGADMTLLKPERAKLDHLNTAHGMDGMNYFYICFGCKGITQIGFPDTQEMALSSTVRLTMWTRDELKEVRKRAELEASIKGSSDDWRHACLMLACAADRLDAMTDRIERGLETAIATPLENQPWAEPTSTPLPNDRRERA